MSDDPILAALASIEAALDRTEAMFRAMLARLERQQADVPLHECGDLGVMDEPPA